MTVVGLDVSAIPPDPRGAGRYVIELVRHVARRSDVELRLESRRGAGSPWREIAPTAAVAEVVPSSRPRRLVWEQLVAPRFVDRWGIDVFHGPHYTMPEIAKVPKVVTIHDLTFFDHPDLHERVKVSFFTRAIKVAAKRADALICVSEATARRLRELLDPKAPVHAIPHGIDHQLFRADDPDGIDAELLARAGVPDDAPYLAFVGTLEPRKNVAGLVVAFDRIAERTPDVRLVIAGGAGWRNDEFDRALARSRHRERIVVTGYVEDRVLPALMRGAAAVVYPAVEEGFGLPALEALACGAPTVTTAGSVMDELARGAAFAVPPRDVDALTELLETLVALPSHHARRALGLEVAATYTWEATAAAHVEVYRAAAGR